MTGLIIISAPSGAGKTTLCARILEAFPRQVKLSISCTTRAPRGNEEDKKHYHFLTQEKFEKMIAQDQFAEYAIVHNHYYGTSKKTLKDAMDQGMSVLLDIDVQGATSLRKAYPNKCLTVFVAPPDINELERRLRDRGTDSEEVIQKRIQNAKDEMKRSAEFDHIIVNDDLDRAYRELKEIVEKKLEGAA